MSQDKTASALEANETAVSQPADSQDGIPQDVNLADYTPEQEARVVRKLDWNLMSLFFVLCELITQIVYLRQYNQYANMNF